MLATQQRLFDYGQLDATTRIELLRIRDEIKHENDTLRKLAAQSFYRIGQAMLKAQALLSSGQMFQRWLEAEYPEWSYSHCCRIMQMPQSFAFEDVEKMSPSVAIELARPSTPQDARDEAMTIIEQGGNLTNSDAIGLIKEHKKRLDPVLPSFDDIIDAEIEDDEDPDVNRAIEIAQQINNNWVSGAIALVSDPSHKLYGEEVTIISSNGRTVVAEFEGTEYTLMVGQLDPMPVYEPPSEPTLPKTTLKEDVARLRLLVAELYECVWGDAEPTEDLKNAVEAEMG